MKSITIRGIDERLQNALKKQAEKQHQSLNKTILQILKKSLGIEKPVKYRLYDDLDDLAGTWTAADEASFNQATARFSEIEDELWK